MTPEEFLAKWKPYAGKETPAYQSHFDDLCRLVGHATPIEADPSASSFCFQKATTKDSGRPGFADVFYLRNFAWEYKGNHGDLEKAQAQLLQYRENLQNPPLLIASDFTHFLVKTNFTNSISKTFRFDLDDLVSGKRLPDASWTAMQVLHACFHDPPQLNPAIPPIRMTEGAAKQFERLADSLRDAKEARYDAERREYPRSYSDEQVAKFLTRMIFCMFASDVGLLPRNIITRLIDQYRATSTRLAERMGALFAVMATGDDFGTDEIPFFDGGLFSDDEALAISGQYVDQLRLADQLDWSDIEPSIFGTLFERILDPKRRKQIGAHYTSREDIELIVRPVLTEPLERDWAGIGGQLEELNLFKNPAGVVERRERGRVLLQGFIDRLGATRVLDPACGSGNFL